VIGRTLGHYRIDSKLGEGGMGVVYQAHDLHLDRPVAIKVLPPEAVADPHRRQRFVQEARSASALNHPNIIHIYDINSVDGVDYIAMEYVAGQTLDHVIGPAGLRLPEALRYAVQIADGLAKAHAAGIVHRDLKPSNVMITADGLVKILDFGLAKLTERASESSASDATLSLRTEEGVIVGTVTYMSPEQAEGRRVDTRSDIFSFGAVVYEMLSGRRAFQAESRLGTLTAILHQEPPALEQVPPSVRGILRRCLRKEPARRFQHMDDVRVLLDDLEPEAPTAPVATGSPRPWPPVLVALLAAAALGAGAYWWWARRSVAPAPRLVFTRLTSDAGLTRDPALSPDGNLLAYASDRAAEGNLDVWVQQVAGGAPIRLTNHPADDTDPAFSPDGSRIAFRSDRDGGGIYIVPALGGEARLVARQGRNPRFSPDGNLLLYWTRLSGGAGAGGAAHVVPTAGGETRSVHPDIVLTVPPIWSPDGRAVLLRGGRAGVQEYWLAPLEGGTPRPTGFFQWVGRYRLRPSLEAPGFGVWTGDRLLFGSGHGDANNLWEATLSAGTGQLGEPRRLTSGSTVDTQPAIAGSRMAYASLLVNTDVWSLPLDANQGKVTGEIRRLTSSIDIDTVPSISADGSKLVYETGRVDRTELRVRDLPGGREATLTPAPGRFYWPRISPDRSRVLYAADESPRRPFYVVPVGGGLPEKVCQDCGWPWSWSPDGARLLYVNSALPARNVSCLEVGVTQGQVIVEHPEHGLFQGQFAPDGQWIAWLEVFAANRSRVLAAPLRGCSPIAESDRRSITTGEAFDDYLAWSPDGRLLYFISDRDGFPCLWAVRLDLATRRPQGAPFSIAHFHSARRAFRHSRGGMSVARDQLVLNLTETTGNIWMAQPEGAP
jgi:Tol biopolymer transport system component